MLSPVTSVSSVYPASIDHQSNSKPAPSAPAASHQDTVTLSPAAQKASASVDVDHDGDSH